MVPGLAYAVLISDTRQLLQDEPMHQFDIFVRLLDRVGKEWAEPVEVGEPWDRAAKPFHVIFQEIAEQLEMLSARFEAIGIEVELLGSE